MFSTVGCPVKSSKAAHTKARWDVFLSFFSVNNFCSSFRCTIAARLYAIVKTYEEDSHGARDAAGVRWLHLSPTRSHLRESNRPTQRAGARLRLGKRCRRENERS